MHQPPAPQGRRSGNSIPPECALHTQAIETEPTEAAATSNMFPDFNTVFGFAQELTDNLETQLGNFDSRGLSESLWTFNEEATLDGLP